MIIEERIFKGIPVLVGFNKFIPSSPLVVLSHGFKGSKESWREHIPDFVARGFTVAALDNRGHGKRTGPDFLGRTFSRGKWNILGIRRMIQETAEDILVVLDHILRQSDVDPSRIGLAGVSMGAFASLKAMVMDQRIRAAVSIIGSPYWDDFFPGTIEEVDPERRRMLNAFAAGHQPASFPDRFFPRAALFQTGETDPHLNSLRVMEFCRQLASAYSSASERLCCVEHPGVAHEFTRRMWEKTLAWFERFL
jgi:pimeloyl-ACP methyl ester carboxylesterase